MSKPIQLFPRGQAAGDPLIEEPPESREAPGALSPVLRARAGLPGGAAARAAVEPPGAQAERALVGALLLDNSLYDLVVDIVRPTDFLEPVVSKTFGVLADIIEGRLDGLQVADAITVASRCAESPLVVLRGWMDAASVEPALVLTHARVVRDAATERGLKESTARAHSIAGEDIPLQERAGKIQELLTEAADVRPMTTRSLGEAAATALMKIADRAKAGETGIGITTGFEDLDAILAGLHGGDLVVLAARPGIGKTALAIGMGLAASAAGYETVMASMEMQAEALGQRAVSIVSGVDSHALRIGALSADDWERVVTASEELAALPYEIVDADDTNLSSLAALARKRKREGRIGLLIVDYLQIMEVATNSRQKSREQEVAALSRGLKKLAMRLNIPVIALSQLSRAVETRVSKRPQMSDLRESGAIEQDADVIMFIHRDDSSEDCPQAESVAEIIVGKQRSGPTGVVRLLYARRNTAFHNYPRPVSHEPHLAAA